MNLPIILTWLRIALIPIFTVVFFLPSTWLHPHWADWVATAIFIIAGVTDWFDGFLARLWNQTSDFGAFLDPVADKLMVAVALILLVYLQRTSPLLAMIIIGREITISALREWMAQIGKRNNVAVATIGKLKTVAQMGAIVLLLLNNIPTWHLDLNLLGNILMIIASVLTLWSMFYYLKIAFTENSY